MPLTMLKVGESACVKEIVGGRTARAKLSNLGFVGGKKVKVFSENNGPLIVGLGENRIAIGRGMAHKIIVDRNGCEN